MEAQNRRGLEKGQRERDTEGYEGVFIPQPPKLAIVHLSSGFSEDIFGHSEKSGHSESFFRYSEHFAEKAL